MCAGRRVGKPANLVEELLVRMASQHDERIRCFAVQPSQLDHQHLDRAALSATAIFSHGQIAAENRGVALHFFRAGSLHQSRLIFGHERRRERGKLGRDGKLCSRDSLCRDSLCRNSLCRDSLCRGGSCCQPLQSVEGDADQVGAADGGRVEGAQEAVLHDKVHICGGIEDNPAAFCQEHSQLAVAEILPGPVGGGGGLRIQTGALQHSPGIGEQGQGQLLPASLWGGHERLVGGGQAPLGHKGADEVWVERKRIAVGDEKVRRIKTTVVWSHHQLLGDRAVQKNCLGFGQRSRRVFGPGHDEPLSVGNPLARLGRFGSQKRGGFYEQGSAVAVEKEGAVHGAAVGCCAPCFVDAGSSGGLGIECGRVYKQRQAGEQPSEQPVLDSASGHGSGSGFWVSRRCR